LSLKSLRLRFRSILVIYSEYRANKGEDLAVCYEDGGIQLAFGINVHAKKDHYHPCGAHHYC